MGETEPTLAAQDTVSYHPASENTLKYMLMALKKDLQPKLCKTIFSI